ncbi:MAG: sodium:solute symporter family protein [bacterium]
MNLGVTDFSIILIYFLFVIGVGFVLKKYMHSSEDFLLAGRSIPGWVSGLAFLAANLGALEVLGMAANSAKYGMLTAHFYWIGAIPAMLFVAVFMMPFYYGSKARSVPEFLKFRFNEATRGFNAISFAVLTTLMSGINMYAMALILKLLLGWDMNVSIIISAFIVLVYTTLGGLSSSIYNEVIQFFLIIFGILPVTIIGLIEVGGWEGLQSRLPENFMHIWSNTMNASQNPMGIEWIGIVLGLGFVLSFGYWCTDFLVIQRALASKNMDAAQRTPLIAAVPKILFPAIVIIPGLLALALMPEKISENYNMALPMMLQKYYPTGMLGLGLVALLASFMSGMAGNVTAFNTIWTYDIYQTYIKPNQPDSHYLNVGRIATVFSLVVSIGTAYLVMQFDNLMDYMQLLFSFFNAPLFATFLLGMFWKRATPWGAFWGLVLGTLSAGIHYILYITGILHYSSEMTSNFYGSIVSWLSCFLITIIISFFTKPVEEEKLVGLVYSLTKRPKTTNIKLFAACILVLLIIINIIFW